MKSKFVNPILMWTLIMSGLILIFLYSPEFKIFSETFFSAVIFFSSVGYWAYFFIGAIMVNKEAGVSVSKIDYIVKSGVYAKVRHPIYSANMALAWGLFFVFPFFQVLLSVVWANLIMFIWVLLEEYFLLKKFHKEYAMYKKDVSMIIPFTKR